MFRSLRNIIVHIMAAFIRDRDARHKFRNKYKRKSKFRKLRDDNRQIFNDIGKLVNEIQSLKEGLAELKLDYAQHLTEWERERSHIFRVAPLDNSPPSGPDSDVYLAIVCVAKDEGIYLKEWIEFHKMVGVERFYFYDNESDDNTKEILDPYINNGTVVYHFLPNHPITKRRPQEEAYNDAIFKYRDRTRWMAMIDIDEFLFPTEKDTLPEFLVDYEQHPAVVVNWMCFDSNGHDKMPTAHGGLVTANYTRVRKNHEHPLDRNIKSIVDPKRTVYFTVHFGLYYHNFNAVTENLETVRGQFSKTHSSSKIRINHYRSKSNEEFYDKMVRNRKGSPYKYNFNEEYANFIGETENDFAIQKYLPKLKQVMGIKE